MSAALRVAVLALLTLAALGRAAAQGHERHADTPPDQLGQVDFPVSCSAVAQERFLRGMALLHSFWYEEAGKAFRQAAARDPTCAMAPWGDAMSKLRALWGYVNSDSVRAGRAAIGRAEALDARTSRERGYIAAAAAYFNGPDTLDHTTRMVAYARAIEPVHGSYPQDDEAAIQYALALIATARPGDTTFANLKHANAILLRLFRKHPQHPGLAHYIIHANDRPQLASGALEAARRYAEIAPSVPHALHMPSHIFQRLGLWHEDIASNVRATAAGREYERAEHMDGAWGHRLHTMEFLEEAYLNVGMDSAARALVDAVARVRKIVPPGGGAYYRVVFPARYALERGRWSEAAALPVPTSGGAGSETIALAHFARGLGAARSGDTASARREIAELAALADSAGAKHDDYSVRTATLHRQVLEAWTARAAGDTATALHLMGEARARADGGSEIGVLTTRELQGELLLELGRPAEAVPVFAAALEQTPHRARSLFGLARAAELSGDAATARARYQEYLKLMEKADGDRPELAVARRAVAAR